MWRKVYAMNELLAFSRFHGKENYLISLGGTAFASIIADFYLSVGVAIETTKAEGSNGIWSTQQAANEKKKVRNSSLFVIETTFCMES